MNINKLIKNCDGDTLSNFAKSMDIDEKLKQNLTDFMFDTVLSDNVEMTERLLKAGIDVDIQDKFGNTPIFYVVERRQSVEMFELLVKFGANLEHKNNKGESPIFCAMSWVKAHGKVDFLSLLIEKKVDVDCANKNGVTPMMKACCCDNLDWIDQLLNAKAKINLQDKNGRTALMYAVKFGKHEGGVVVEERLLKHSAKTLFKDKDGKSALDYAKERKLEIVCKLLERNMKCNKFDKEKS